MCTRCTSTMKCQGAEVVFILAGLGGGAGSGISPVLARIAKAVGALVLAFVTTPFSCEGTHRQAFAEQGLEELREAADGVICLPNQKILQLIEDNTSVVDTFKIANRLLADAVRGHSLHKKPVHRARRQVEGAEPAGIQSQRRMGDALAHELHPRPGIFFEFAHAFFQMRAGD